MPAGNRFKSGYQQMIKVEPGRHSRPYLLSVLPCALLILAGCGDTPAVQHVVEASPIPTAEAPPAIDDNAPPVVDAPHQPTEDWTKFLGPHDTGVSDETGLLARWPEAGPPVVWKKKVGSGYTAPSILGQKLILFQRIGDDEVVECLDTATGDHVWDFKYPTQFIDPYGYDNGPRCAPLLTKDRCYTFGAEGMLTCLDLSNGKKVWQVDTAREFDVPEAFFGVGACPILEGDLLITMVGGQPDAGLVAFHKDTGKTVWQSVGQTSWEPPKIRIPRDRKLASYATPIAATIHGRRVVLAFMRPGLVAVDAQSGAVRFSYFFRATFGDSVNAARPVVVGDQIFLSAAYDVGAALLKVHKDVKGYDEVWRDELAMQTHWSTPIHHEGYVYGFSGRHEVGSTFRCIELATGRLKWETEEANFGDIPDPKDGRGRNAPKYYGRGSKILADGKFIVLGERGLLALVALDSEKFTEISRVQFPELEYPSWVAPVLSRKRLYLRDLDDLMCLDLKAP